MARVPFERGRDGRTCQNTAASGFEELELNGSAGLLLNDDRACANPATADEIADLDFNYVASPELTVDREIEHRAVSKPSLSIQPEPDGPDLLWLQRAFAAKLPARVPWRRSLAPGSYSECPIAFLLSAILGQKKNWPPSRSTPGGLAEGGLAAFEQVPYQSDCSRGRTVCITDRMALRPDMAMLHNRH
jgi:hypothetical protein